METISYGITKDYLSHWNINEALREIMQNFLDYGEYNIEIGRNDIVISNSYSPNDLSFLGLGKSVKKDGSRGKYGEGLKMALFIFAREDLDILVQTEDKTIIPTFIDSVAGKVFALEIEENRRVETKDNFSVHFHLDYNVWLDFYNNIIKEKDIIFSDNYYGDIVNKEKGNIYCGGLFVANVDNISKAYNIKPTYLQLDRDRKMLPSFDVNWACSKINEAQGKINVKDFTYSDTEYITKIPSKVKKNIRPRLIGNSIEPTYQDKGKTVVIKNQKVKDAMINDSFFSRTIKRIKMYLAKQLGLYELLLEFKKKHVHSADAKKDFEIILERIENSN